MCVCECVCVCVCKNVYVFFACMIQICSRVEGSELKFLFEVLFIFKTWNHWDQKNQNWMKIIKVWNLNEKFLSVAAYAEETHPACNLVWVEKLGFRPFKILFNDFFDKFKKIAVRKNFPKFYSELNLLEENWLPQATSLKKFL